MNPSLVGQVALVTGGTSGIGRATAVAFARSGAKVVLSGRRELEGNETVRLVQEAGGEANFVRADVRIEADVAALVKATLDRFGRLDVAFNNAGVEGDFTTMTADQSVEHYQVIFDTNVKGILLSMKHEIRAMLSRGGAIVNNASVAGTVGIPGAGVYVASKHAVIGLTRCAAVEYAKHGIRINSVSPGGIATELIVRAMGGIDSAACRKMVSRHPIGRIGQPEEVAAAVVWLCSSEASYVIGHDLLVDGGFVIK